MLFIFAIIFCKSYFCYKTLLCNVVTTVNAKREIIYFTEGTVKKRKLKLY